MNNLTNIKNSFTNQKKKIINLKNRLEILYLKDILKSTEIIINSSEQNSFLEDLYEEFYKIIFQFLKVFFKMVVSF